MEHSFIAHIEKSIQQNWTLPALSDHKGVTYTYEDLARKIAKVHIIFEKTGIKKGDRIALVGRNSANWAVTFLAITSYGAVVVPILHEFKPDNVHHIVNHSEAMVLFVGDVIWENLNEAMMPHVKCIISVADYSILHENTPFSVREIRAKLNDDYARKYPSGINPGDDADHGQSIW